MNPPNADKCKTPTAMEGKVLASLCITCYNQERSIREAVQSAFDQTYSPLEIVISDDASTNRNAQIVQEMIAAYKGPHKIVFNCNDTNLFVAKNYEKAFKLAHGEILATGAGDDISMPDRIEKNHARVFRFGSTGDCDFARKREKSEAYYHGRH